MMSRQIIVYVILFISILFFGCMFCEVFVLVSSLDNYVKLMMCKVNIIGLKYIVKKGDILYLIVFSF